MFDGLKNIAGMASMFKDLPKMQAKLEEVKRELGGMIVQAETGGGAVSVTAAADMTIHAVKIDPAVMSALVEAGSPEDHAMAEELISGAVNLAMQRARDAAQEHLAAAAGEMGLPMPPGGLLGP